MSKKILIVDDDPRVRGVYQVTLESQGFEVACEPDGEKALSAIKKEKPDLVLLDIMMPKVQGLDILDIIKSTPEVSDIQIIVFSALSDASAKERAEKFGATKYLVKSETTMEEVINTIKSYVN